MIRYMSMTGCKNIIFPMIGRNMVSHEPAPKYHMERSGIEQLDSILHLMQSRHYPDLKSKAAYMFCSIIDGHPFSNGNKRLAVALLANFLLLNGCGLFSESIEMLHRELKKLFPDLQWSEVKTFRYPHEYFLYYLALVIADRHQKGNMTFPQERAAVEAALKIIVDFSGASSD